jgi:hypothetical protein
VKFDVERRIDAREHSRGDVDAERDDRLARIHIRDNLAAFTTDGYLTRHVPAAEVFVECKIDETANGRDRGETTKDDVTHRCAQSTRSVRRSIAKKATVLAMAKVPTRSACVVAGATPAQVRAIAEAEGVTIRENRLGTLVTGALDGSVIDYAAMLDGPVYDVMFNAGTSWFAVTIYIGETQPRRWDNRPDEDAGYPRIPDVLGATSPAAILEALDIPADALGYAPS